MGHSERRSSHWTRGFSVAVDDFGSGYSTLGFVRDIVFDTLKIDRSFLQGDIEEKRNKAMIEGVIGLGKKLGAKTVVEGVENAEQLSFLNCSGCNLLQGDYLCEPLPEYRFLDLHIFEFPAGFLGERRDRGYKRAIG